MVKKYFGGEGNIFYQYFPPSSINVFGLSVTKNQKNGESKFPMIFYNSSPFFPECFITKRNSSPVILPLDLHDRVLMRSAL